MGKKENNFLNFDSARTKEQIDLMKQIEKDGVCPFCPDYFAKYHPKPIIKETPWWFLTENMSPYEGTRYHFLFVYKKHITSLEEIDPEAIKDLLGLTNDVVRENNIEGGSLFMRFGDTRYNGSSVAHMHAQLISGGIKDSPDEEPLRVKLGWKH